MFINIECVSLMTKELTIIYFMQQIIEKVVQL